MHLKSKTEDSYQTAQMHTLTRGFLCASTVRLNFLLPSIILRMTVKFRSTKFFIFSQFVKLTFLFIKKGAQRSNNIASTSTQRGGALTSSTSVKFCFNSICHQRRHLPITSRLKFADILPSTMIQDCLYVVHRNLIRRCERGWGER